MCLLEKPLVSSHLMPAALYEYCRKGEHKPIRIGDGFLLPTDRQTQTHLLCYDCEDVLNRGGETWLLDKLATWERTFPLYDLLADGTPDLDEEGMALYFAAKNPQLKTDKVTHFALGMFWKASVHAWGAKDVDSRIDLGPCSDRIRRWLLGDSEFPKNVYLVASVSRPQRAQITLNDPYESKHQGWRSFILHVPGLLFMLNVGKTVDESMRWLCLNNNLGHPISVCDDLMKNFEWILATNFQLARKTRSFLKSMGRITQSRKPK
jgi:hypothetical protein